MEYDIAIIGAGPGGYVAAIRAKQLGLTVALIEKETQGGVCLNWGCIPSKSLIHQAEIFSEIPHIEKWGVNIDVSKFQYSSVHKTSRKAVKKLTAGVGSLLKKNSVDFIKGEAYIKGPQEIEVKGQGNIKAKKIIIATGSRPRIIPGFEFDEKTVLSSTGILSQEELPKSLVILGAGAIGMEFAFVMNAFGVAVTLIEMMPQVLPLEDKDIATVVEKSFASSGITIHTATKATKMTKSDTSVSIDIENEKGEKSTLKAEKLLVAVGRAPNTEGLGLDNIGVSLEKGYIKIKDYNETNIPGIYAIGDIVWGTPLLAHVASKEGEIAVEHIAGHAHEASLDMLSIPSAVYCNPQVGSFGLTEEKAKTQGIDYKTASFSYAGAGKAVAIEQANGIVKIITDNKNGEIIGAHIVGYSATEIIHELLLARKGELMPEDIATMIHAHPTISEAVMEGARAIEGWVIHG